MVGMKDAFVDAKEVCRLLGIGTTKAYAIIREYNKELAGQGFLTIRGRCPRKYFESKIYGYADIYNPAVDLERDVRITAKESNAGTKEKVPPV
jgi:hypothetical protein